MYLEREECGCGGLYPVYIRERGGGTGRLRSQNRHLSCHTHLDILVSRRSQSEDDGEGAVFEEVTRLFVYYESLKRESKTKPIYGCHNHRMVIR